MQKKQSALRELYSAFSVYDDRVIKPGQITCAHPYAVYRDAFPAEVTANAKMQYINADRFQKPYSFRFVSCAYTPLHSARPLKAGKWSKSMYRYTNQPLPTFDPPQKDGHSLAGFDYALTPSRRATFKMLIRSACTHPCALFKGCAQRHNSQYTGFTGLIARLHWNGSTSILKY
ncbi:MAG: hypothetical protein JWO03_3418 [Bacteroidetes bacterium]|nr:hypothetical protein [Bacteroidota bacterium]